ITTDAQWQRLCDTIPAMEPLRGWDLRVRRERSAGVDGILLGWASRQRAAEAEACLRRAGVPAAALAGTRDLVASEHLRARGSWRFVCRNRRAARRRRARLELAAPIRLVEALGIFLRRLRPSVTAAAQGAGEVRRALFVEGAAALFPIGRHLDQQVVDQVLDV